MEKIVLVGAGGYCSAVIDSILNEGKYEIAGITDPVKKKSWYGFPVLGTDDILSQLYENGIRKAHITVGSIAKPNKRKELANLLENIGFELVTVIDPSAQIARGVELGKMVYVGKRAIINAMVNIGDYCMINTGAIVEHGCKIENWVHLAPGSTLAADITIGDSSHIGVGATVLQGLTIGHDTVVGAGSVVIRDVASNKTVYGVVKG